MSAEANARVAMLAVILLVATPTAVAAATSDAPNAECAQQILEVIRPLADNGDARAQYNMGVLYDEGYGVQRDYAKARQWYEKAAAQHYPRAEHNLGIMYKAGKGVTRDPSKAAQWFRRGADDGETAAQNNLAVLYIKGEGVTRNTGKAAFWAARAAAGGNSAAIDNLPHIIADLPHIHANADDVNVRDQPGRNARVVDHIDSDTLLIVLARRDDWTQILLPETYIIGWVANFLLSDSPAPLAANTGPGPAVAGSDTAAADTTPPEADNSPAPGDGQTTAPTGESGTPDTSQASGRKEPDTSIPTKPATSKTRPEAADESQLKPAAGQTEFSAATKPAASSNTAGATYAEVGTSTARLQDWAGSGQRTIGQLHRGDRVELLGHYNGWRYIQTSEGMKGWIAGYLLIIP